MHAVSADNAPNSCINLVPKDIVEAFYEVVEAPNEVIEAFWCDDLVPSLVEVVRNEVFGALQGGLKGKNRGFALHRCKNPLEPRARRLATPAGRVAQHGQGGSGTHGIASNHRDISLHAVIRLPYITMPNRKHRQTRHCLTGNPSGNFTRTDYGAISQYVDLKPCQRAGPALRVRSNTTCAAITSVLADAGGRVIRATVRRAESRVVRTGCGIRSATCRCGV